MKYLCLVYYSEAEVDAMTQSEWKSLVDECMACAASLQASGQFVAGEALQPVHTATTVRVRNGKVSITDGPFAETKEQLAGFYLLDAPDLDGALQAAAKIPPARLGSIEVRPIRDLGAE